MAENTAHWACEMCLSIPQNKGKKKIPQNILKER